MTYSLLEKEGRRTSRMSLMPRCIELDSGHFAVEDFLDEIANTIIRFYLEKVSIAK